MLNHKKFHYHGSIFLFLATKYLDQPESNFLVSAKEDFPAGRISLKQQFPSDVPKKYHKQSRNSVQFALYS